MGIPRVKIENNEIVLPTIEVPLFVNEKEELIVMQKISAEKRKEVLKKVVKTHMVGQQIQRDIDELSFQIHLLSAVIIKAPFPTDEKSIGKLGDEVIDYLYSKYSEFTDSSKKKD